jgi:hypothetical protein
MAGHKNCPTNLRLPKATDMTIHCKALEEHFLMVYGTLIFSIHTFTKKLSPLHYRVKIVGPRMKSSCRRPLVQSLHMLHGHHDPNAYCSSRKVHRLERTVMHYIALLTKAEGGKKQ